MTGRPEPPRIASRLLERALPEDIREGVTGDLEEVFRQRFDRQGPTRARLWYWREAVSFTVRFSGERAHDARQPAKDRVGASVGSARRTGIFHDLPGDVRYAIRGLIRSPQFTVAAVVILGIGIGANTAIFSVVDAVYFDDAPHVIDPDDLVGIYGASRFSEASSLQYPEFEYYGENQEVFDDVLGYDAGGIALTIRSAEARSDARGTFVSHNYFDVLGTRPALGRWFLPEEDEVEGTHLVAVISHGLWARMFDSDASVLGEAIELNGNPFTVIGVAPAGFRGPRPLETPPDVWFPFHTQPVLSPVPVNNGSMLQRMDHGIITWISSIGRLREGIAVDVAQNGMDGLARYLGETYPESTDGDGGVRLYPDARFHPSSASSMSTMTRLLLAVVAAVLLIASANVAILLLARGSARSRDVAVRVAVGAARKRIVRAALTESFVLALLGAGVGIGLAYATSGLVAGVFPATFSVSFEPDRTVLAFACALALGTALLSGLVPALQTSRVDVSQTLKGDQDGHDRSKLRGGLVVAQVAMAVSLAAAAALMGQSFATASGVPLGYEVNDRVLLSTTLSDYGYSEEEGQVFVRRALDRLRAVPGVRSASVAAGIPFEGFATAGIAPPGEPESQDLLRVRINSVGPDFFTSMGIDIVAGRAIDETDVAENRTVVVVSATTARNLWPGQDPIGQTVLRRGGLFLWDVVGVAADTRVDDLDSPPELYGYTALSQRYTARMSFIVHGNVGAGPLRSALQSLDPGMAISRIQTVQDVVDRKVGRFRTAALLVGIFGALAVVLAMVGLYGVLSYAVVRARKDIGIRVALGASSRQVGRAVVGRAMRLTMLGSMVGGLVAFAGAPLLAAFLFGIGPRDPGIWTAAVLLVFVVAGASSLAPALRAAKVDPMVALRAE